MDKPKSEYYHTREELKEWEEELTEKIVGEWYIYPAEAVSKGICDEVVTSISTLL